MIAYNKQSTERSGHELDSPYKMRFISLYEIHQIYSYRNTFHVIIRKLIFTIHYKFNFLSQNLIGKLQNVLYLYVLGLARSTKDLHF